MKKVLIIAVVLFNVGIVFGQSKQSMPYKNPTLPVEKRVADLIARMTLEEKVYQMCALRLGDGDEVFKTSGVYSADYIRSQMKTHGVGHISCPTTDMNAELSVKTANEIQKIAVEETRLGIPTLINDETLHGCRGIGSNSYPQLLALSCTWNIPLMAEISAAIAKETYSRGIRQGLSPVLDLGREPRHGRFEETFGEDPYLASRFGVAYVKGHQENGVICTPKPFVGDYIKSRDALNSSFSERDYRELYFVPYKAVFMEAGAKSVMMGYLAVDGVPASANKWLITDILRNEWSFKGFTVSDWSGVNHMMGNHKVAGSLGEAAVMAANAGLDVDLPRLKSYVQLIDMVKQGKIKQSVIDESVKRILRVKFEMGLFEHPYIEDTTLAAKLNNSPECRKLALTAAEQSIVLLKNKNNVLPLAPSVKNIAVIGPNANKLQLGGYSAREVHGATPLEGIKNILGTTATVRYAEGCTLTGSDKSGFHEAVNIAEQSDVCILVMGGQYGLTGGESQDRVDLNLMGVQEDLIKEISALGKPVIVVLSDGRPVTILNWIDKVDGVLMMFPAGEEGGNALAGILSGKVNPSGKLTVTIPRHTGQLPLCLLTRPYGREGSIAEYPEMTRENSVLINRYNPLFPFGYGLSYTTFSYSNLKFSKNEYAMTEPVEVSVDITNTGKQDGDEIAQLYFTDLNVHSISLPKKQLKSFRRVHIAAGATQTVKFTLRRLDMEYLNASLKPELNPGKFEVFIGGDCITGVTDVFSIK